MKMIKKTMMALVVSVTTLGVSASAVHAATPAQVDAFITKMTPAILADTSKYGLYPSIQMAQAALESGWGLSQLSTQANNFFGVKGAYNGQSVTMKTIEY